MRWVLLALLLSALLVVAYAQWWVLPRLDNYRAMLAAAVGDYLQTSVRIEGMTAIRDGWRLGLRLREVSLQKPGGEAVVAHFAQAAIAFDLWRSLREWRPVVSRIRLDGVNLTLEQGTDGGLRLFGMVGNTEAGLALPEFGRWLFSLRKLEIVGERLVVRQQGGTDLWFPHPYLQLEQTASGQRLLFHTALPMGFGDRIQLEVERPAALNRDPKQGQGHFRFHAPRLALAGWPLPLPFVAGEAALVVDGVWQDWRPTHLQGQLRLTQAALKGELRSGLLKTWLASRPENELRFTWERQEAGWALQGTIGLRAASGSSLNGPAFTLHRNAKGWRGTIHALQAQDALAWITPWLEDSARRWLVPLDLRGELPEITLEATPDLANYSAAIQLRGLRFQPVRGLPGFDGVTGTLTFGPQDGQLELDSQQLRVDTAGLLRAPILLEKLAGTISWRRLAAELRLESNGLALANPDLHGRFWGSVALPAEGDPLLDIRGEYWDIRGDQVKRYLPVAVISPKAIAWLDRALISGRVTKGDVVFQGPPARFPFDRGEGQFETRFKVENAVVDYHPGWPRLERGQTTVTFRNRGMWLEADSGRLLDSAVENLTVVINDLDKAVIEIRGRAKGKGSSMWGVLEESPTGRTLGEDLPALRIDGSATLDLVLTIPLDARPTTVEGKVSLVDNDIGLRSSNTGFQRVRGEIHFTESDLTAKGLQASLRGQPVRLDLDLAGREGARELRIQARGRLALADLLENPAMLRPYFDGKSDWEAVLTAPAHRSERIDVPSFTLTLRSDLRGSTVRLLAPLGKSVIEARPFKLTVWPTAGGKALAGELEYGAQVRAALTVSDFASQPRFERGELRINAGPAKLPEESGLRVIANLARWSPPLAIAPVAKEQGNRPAGERAGLGRTARSDVALGTMDFLRAVDARIDNLVIGAGSFAKVRVEVKRQEAGFLIDCTGEKLSGRLTLPDQPTPERPVDIALRRLYVDWLAEAGNESRFLQGVSPRSVPPLEAVVTDLRVNGAELGRFRLSAVPRSGGLYVKEAHLDFGQRQIAANGEWLENSTGHNTKLEATLHSQSLGEALAIFGYPDNGVERGETEANLVAEWEAALPDFSLARLMGTLKLRVGPGQLRSIKPGLGRLIGMLNVQNLTRRLSFDFSDLFQPGMGFDQIAGTFVFRQGSAYTDDLLVEAPAARIEIRGRTGLQARDFDQIITIFPSVGGALPVAGVLAGGPAVGAAVFVAGRLLRKDIEHATRYHYALKGAWDNPLVEPLRKSPIVGSREEFTGDQ